jgi:hypothetical protein
MSNNTIIICHMFFICCFLAGTSVCKSYDVRRHKEHGCRTIVSVRHFFVVIQTGELLQRTRKRVPLNRQKQCETTTQANTITAALVSKVFFLTVTTYDIMLLHTYRITHRLLHLHAYQSQILGYL